MNLKHSAHYSGNLCSYAKQIARNTPRPRGVSSLLLFGLAIFFSSCARPFQPLALETRSFSQTASTTRLLVTYDTFDILKVSNNRRYMKKARKRNLQFLPVKLTNNTDDTLVIAQTDLQIFEEYEAVSAPSLEKLSRIRQVSWPYLLFILGDFNTGSSSGDIDISYNYVLPVGTAWGVTNFLVARVANQKFKEAIQQYATFPIAVLPRQTDYALLPIVANLPPNQLQMRYVAPN